MKGLFFCALLVLGLAMYMHQFKIYNFKPTPKTLTQKKITEFPESIFDKEGLKQNMIGWTSDVGFKDVDMALGPEVKEVLGMKGHLLSKMWNFHWLDTGKHIFQFVAATLTAEKIKQFHLIVYTKDGEGKVDLSGRQSSVGFLLTTENKMNRGSLDDITLESERGGDKVVLRLNENEHFLQIRSESLDLLGEFRILKSESEPFFWIQPQAEDLKSAFFGTGKHSALQVQGTYTLGKREFSQCQKEKICLMSVDAGRGVFGLNTAWYWAAFQTVLPDGTILGFNSGDGIGHQAYYFKERASEDFISVNGKIVKMDAMEMIYDQDDLSKEIKLKTTEENKAFPENSCDLVFSPHGNNTEGADLAFSAFVQTLVIGHWNGVCEFVNREGEKKEVKVENVLGTVEYLWGLN